MSGAHYPVNRKSRTGSTRSVIIQMYCGASNLQLADAARLAGIEVFVIGVKDDINSQDMEVLAYDADHVSYKSDPGILDRLVKDMANPCGKLYIKRGERIVSVIY